jgi:hypothetical protein
VSGASNLRDLADYKKCGNLHEKRHGKFNKLVRGKCKYIISQAFGSFVCSIDNATRVTPENRQQRSIKVGNLR